MSSTNFADLILGFRTEGHAKTQKALSDTTKGGAAAEASVDKMGKGFVRAGRGAATAAPMVGGFNKTADRTRGLALAATKALAGMAAGYASFQAAGAAMTAARGLNSALAETSTLIEGTPQQLDAITASARAMAKEYGGSATSQVQAYYQAISAGAANVEEATTRLEASNKLAIGGATDVTTATGILSGVINSYGKEAITATQVSDALFVGMKTGVTTVGELSASLGGVIPTAKSLGISFDEVVAATAALTKNNLTTSAAVTSLNAALVGVIKPTKQASDMAAQLGIEFNAAGLQSQGLATFLANIVDKTGGNVDAMSQLFGSVEALKAALLFAGEAGGQYNDILAQMGVKTGATQEAFDKMSKSLDQRWNRAVSSAVDVGLVLGNALLTVVVPVLEGAALAVTTLADNADVLAIALGILGAHQIPAVVGGLVSMSAWLATSEGLFIAGAIAAKSMALAMSAIPFVAIVAGVTGVVRLAGAMKTAKAAAADMSVAVGDSIAAMARLNGTSVAYYSNVTHGNYMAAKAAADFNKVQAEGALQAAKIHLAAKERVSNMLYLGLAETKGLRNARIAVTDMGNAFLEADATASAFDYSIEKIKLLFGEVAVVVDSVASSLAGYTAASFSAVPAIGELTSQYGFMATTMQSVLQAQNELAASDASAGITKLLTDISGVSDKLGLGVDQAGDFQQALSNIAAMDTFQGQANALAGLAAHLVDANGDLSSMDATTRQVYQSMLDAAIGAAGLGQQISIAHANTTGLGAAIANIAPQFAPAIGAANQLATAIGNVLARLGGVASGLLGLSRVGSAVAAATEGAGGLLKSLGGTVIGSASKALESVAGNLKSVWSEANKGGASVAGLQKHLNGLVSSSGSGGGGKGGAAKQLSDEAKEAAKSLKLAEREAERLTDAINRPLVGAIDGMASAVGDFVTSGLKGFRDFGKAILSSITSAISQAVAFAVANPIKVALGLSGGLTGGTATAATAGQGAASGGGILNGLSGLASGKGILGSIASKGIFGASGVFGSLGSSLGTSIGSALAGPGSALAASLGGIGASIGAIVPILGIAAAAFSFFKKSVKELDAGVRLTVDGMDSYIETFSKTETKRFWGLSKKTSTKYSAADAEVADPLNAIVASMQGNVLAAATALGVGSDAYSNFAHEITLSTKDMSEDEAQAAITEALNGVGNAFADLTPQLEQFIRDGEESGATLTRIVSDLGSVNQMLDTLGHRLLDVSVIGAGTASNFAALFGGIDAMNTATTAFYTGFYSEAEQFATATRQIEAQFAAINVTMPKTRDAFRSLVDGLDTSSESGREMYAALVSMSGALDAVLPTIANFTAEIAAMGLSTTTLIDAMVSDTSTLMQANETAAALWYRTADTLRDFIADLRGTASELTSGAAARAFSEARFQTLLASAIGGDNDAAGDLTAAGRTLLDNTRATARTSLEMARAEARVLNDLSLVSGVSDIEGARHDVVAGLLGQQVDLLGTVRDAINSGNPLEPSDIDGLNGQLGSLEGAIKAAEMINYAFLKERLNVSVDLIADAQIPESLRALLSNAATGITGTIDFITRSDLAPDQKWLALTSSSEHIKTVDLVTGALLDPNTAWVAVRTNSTLTKTVDLKTGKLLDLNTAWVAMNTASSLNKTVNLLNGKLLDPNTAWVAVNTASSLTKTVDLTNGKLLDLNTAWVALNTISKLDKTVNLLAGAKLPSDVMTLALSGNSELSRTVNAALASGIDQDALQLALGSIGDYTVAIRAGFSLPNVGEAAQRVLFAQTGGYVASVRSVFDLQNIGAAARRVLFWQQGEYVANISGILAQGTSGAVQSLLLNANTQALRAVTISTAFAGGLSGVEAEALRQSGAIIQRTIQSAVTTDGLTQTGHRILWAENAAVSRVINGYVNTSSLTASQSALLGAINGQSDGRITLGGSFSFDPSTGFQTWFGGATESNIAAPMSALSTSLDLLRAEIAAQQAEAANSTIGNAAVSGLSRDASGNILTTMAGLAGVANAVGVSTNQAPNAVAEQVANFSATDQISGFNIVGSMTDYLFQQLKSGKVAVDGADYLNIYSDLKAAGSGYQNDPAGHFEDHGLAEILSGNRAFIPQAFDWSSVGITIPGFAKGVQNFAGGLAQINERGGEIVRLPSGADVVPHDLSKRMVDRAPRSSGPDNREIIKELRALNNRIDAMDKRQARYEYNKEKRDRRVESTLTAIDLDGVKERVE